jgi:hypothetical protein
MEKRRKPIQIYAMVVNIVAIIAFLIAGTAVVSALIDRGNPLYAGYSQIDLSSFDKYKMDALKSTSKDAAFIPTDEEIRRMYDAAREDHINKIMHRTYRDLIVSVLTLIVAITLFGTHWWLMKKYGD